ncbi:MAG: protoporphyrinogen oxidase [Thermomicrobiales bacterium]|nr:protoporphyrinogen oxidase [Thermomicrobiales bacterium]
MCVATPTADGDGSPRVVIIGGGITGLAAAHRLTTYLPQARVTLLEQDARLGGKIITERREGFLIEGGPEALLTVKPAGALCADLGLGPALQAPRPESRRSYILRDGQLQPLPDGLGNLTPTQIWPLVTTPIISPLGKLRMGLDLVLPRRRDPGDESLAHFIERRLGREAYAWLVNPLVGGIYAADGHRLSLAATFPHLRRLEQEHGGMIRGTLAARRQAPPAKGGGRPAPFQAPRGGLSELVDALAARLRAADVRVETASAASAVRRRGQGYAVSRASGETEWADAVICAAPAPAAATLLAGLDPRLTEHLRAIPHASVTTLALAYPRQAIPHPLAGSGYLTPRAERRPVRACTWVSAKWAGRAPEDASLLRVSFGGAGQSEISDASDDDLLRLAREEVRAVLGVTAPPRFTRVFRWPQAMPQYEVGHLERLSGIDACLDDSPNLALAGNAYRGVGVADCLQSGEQAADRLITYFASRGVAAQPEASPRSSRWDRCSPPPPCSVR